jgi:UDP-N-acetylglucosamine 1-carboxyvinyltransferase
LFLSSSTIYEKITSNATSGGNISKFVIVGGQKLSGQINVNGAKNAAMKMLAASVLTKSEVVLQNVPQILDVDKLSAILTKMGAEIIRDNHTLRINNAHLRAESPDPTLVASIRASVVLIGPLLARFKKLDFTHPGGDKIGSRPIDRHLKAFRDLGVEVSESKKEYHFNLPEKLNTKTRFEEITWTGTENLLIFAAGLEQTTTIENIALEPEVFNLIEFLEKMGAKITVKDRMAIVTGRAELSGAKIECISDRLEAATFAVLAAAAGEGIEIKNCPVEFLDALWEKFSIMGIPFEKKQNSVYIKEPSKIAAVNISTSEYPGFVTDTQPPMGLLLTQAEGESFIQENIFENRLGYLKELQKMGAKIEILNNHEAKIFGPAKLHGAEIDSLDIRAGATLLVAGLIADGETIINEAENIDRGYEKIEERLRLLGAKISRTS